MRSGFGSTTVHTGSTQYRFYLRDSTPTYSPTSGEKSAAHPATYGGSPLYVTDPGNAEKSLKATAGTSQSTLTAKGTTHHNPQELYVGRFSSDPLAAQMIPAVYLWWYMNLAESNSNAQSYLQVPVVYVWRPSTSAVVGYILDSATYNFWGVELGNGFANTKYGQVNTGLSYITNAVTVANGDILVVEIWLYSEEGSHKSYTNTLYYNGTTDPSAGSSEASTASSLYFSTGIHMYS